MGCVDKDGKLLGAKVGCWDKEGISVGLVEGCIERVGCTEGAPLAPDGLADAVGWLDGANEEVGLPVGV